MIAASLPAYARFAAAVAQLRALCPTLAAFTAELKGNGGLSRLRNGARAELQGLYEIFRKPLGLPGIPVYLPVRKKIAVCGRAHALGGMPREIRVYPIYGPAGKDYSRWRPMDVRIDSEDTVFETVLHESAHVLEVARHGRMGHEENFVEAYCAIETHLVRLGLVGPLGSPERFSGCPAGSAAARHCGRPRRARS
ncbi:MAG: hypothetical protein AB1578_10500 [Thermodesulfobacteriota bacterium]